MAHTLGIITVGQAPRDDMADLFAEHAPPGTKVILRGALDGLSEAAIDAAKPENGPDTLYTKLRGGRDVKLSKKAVIARSPETFAKLRADGCDVIVYACTGDFPPMEGDEGILFPSRVERADGRSAAARSARSSPVAETEAENSARNGRGRGSRSSPRRWRRAPTPEKPRLRRDGWRRSPISWRWIAGYSPSTKEQVKPVLGVPTLLAITATGRVLREMLD